MSKKVIKRLVIGVVSVCCISGLGYAAYPTFTIQCTDLVRENDRNPREFEKVEFNHYVRATSKLYNVIVPEKYVDWDYPKYYSGGNESMYATVFNRVKLKFNLYSAKFKYVKVEYPDKELYEGTKLDPNKVSLIAVYENGEEKLSSKDGKLSCPNVVSVGENKITFEYNGKEYLTTVKGKELTKIMKTEKKYADELKDSVESYVSDTTFITIRVVESDKYKYWLTHVVITNPEQISGGLSDDTYGGTRELPTEFYTRTNSIITLNGSYFSYDTGKPTCAGVFIKNGELVYDGTTNGNEVCLTYDGKLFTPDSGVSGDDLLAMNVKDSWGTADPLLIQNGEFISTQDALHIPRYPRTALGMVEPGEYYFINAGRTGYAGGLTFEEMQSIFHDLGCTYARSLDGGGSSSLVYKGNKLNNSAAGVERPVVDFVHITD